MKSLEAVTSTERSQDEWKNSGYSPFCTTLYINAFPTVSKSSFRLYVICVIFIYTRYEFLKIVCLTSVSGSYRFPLTIICSYIYLRYIYLFRVHSHFSLHKTKNVLMWKKKCSQKIQRIQLYQRVAEEVGSPFRISIQSSTHICIMFLRAFMNFLLQNWQAFSAAPSFWGCMWAKKNIFLHQMKYSPD